MSLIVDTQFVARIGPFLKQFKYKGNYVWDCRCPVCGDSAKSRHKTRGGFHRGIDDTRDMLVYSCFNCSKSTNLGKIIELVAPQLLDEYRFSLYREENPIEDEDEKEHIDYEFFKRSSRFVEITYDSSLDSIKRLDLLSLEHPAVRYVKNRKIPDRLWHLFYYAPKFMTWTNSIIPQKFEMRSRDYPRLIIPFLNEHGRMFAFAARAFGNETPKYYTIKLIESEEKIYGRDRIDYSKRIYAVEGQIDAMLLPNAISVSGSSFDTPFIQGIKANVTLVPDNEPRNVQIVAQYRKYIDTGYTVCMLPETFIYKDINEAVIAGMTPEEILDTIDANSYQGFAAKLRFAEWQKCDSNKSKRADSRFDNEGLEKLRA